MISFKNLTLLAVGQAFKTGLAAVVSLYIADLFRLPQMYWSAISAIVVMQSQVGATLTASRGRLIGTAIGACMGSIFGVFLGNTLPWFGVAVVVTMLICQLGGLDQSYRLACVTVAIVMLVRQGASPWPSALHRFLEVGLGIVVALAVTAIPLPVSSARDKNV
ncbi:MAG TPA: FUSC family protein [Candidatus Sulfotelmatobacter sp.]